LTKQNFILYNNFILIFILRLTCELLVELMTREQKIGLYNKLVTTHPDATLKGDTIPYTSLNGHMYSYIAKDGDIRLRLPEEIRLKFLDKYKTRLMEQYGIVQKEYVAVPDNLLKKTKNCNLTLTSVINM
jgi:hypothetical protein